MNGFLRTAALIILATATAALLQGCDKPSAPSGGAGSASSGDSGKLKIGFIVKQPEEPWFQLEWKFADECAAKNGFEVVKIGAADGEKALGAIDNLAVAGAKGVIICTPDVKLGPAIAMKAKSAGLKLLAVDDRFIGSDGKPMEDVKYLGISARKIGENVGQELWKEMQNRKWTADETAACMVTFDELDTARERTEGARAALIAAGFPEARIFAAPQKTSDVPGAFDSANILLTQHPEAKKWLIFGMNDSAVMGAVRSMEGRQFTADTVVGIGINGTDCITEFEKPKPTGFFGSMLLSAREHGYRTTEMMHKWLKDGTEPPADTRTAGIFITRDNFQKLLKEQGIRE